VLIGLILFFSRRNRMPKAARSRFTNRVLLIIAIGFGLFLITRGLPPLLAALGALLPLLPRLLNALKAVNALKFLAGFLQGFGREQTSNIETRWLRMKLNRGSGEISGEVLSGRYQGRSLDQLTLEELLHVLTECYEKDRHSVAILETYLDRTNGGRDWRNLYNNTNKGQEDPIKTGTMTIAEAYKILGLPSGSSRKEVISAYRKLIQKLHPDRGGSAALATQVNKAKNLLLKYLSRNE